MPDDVYDGPGPYDEAAPYEDPFTATVRLTGHANEHAAARATHDGQVVI